MSNEEQEDYFEQLATRFKLIGHTPADPRFCRFNIDEVVSGLVHKLELKHYSLLLEAPSGTLEDNGGDGYFDNQEIAFMVVRRVELRNFPEEKQVLSESRQLGQQLLGQILKERKFCDIDENSIEYEKVGPVFTNCFGYRYSFTASSPIDLTPDPDNWL